MSITKAFDINGYILAGGKSSRMGKDKGLMLFQNKAMILPIIECLTPMVNQVIIVSNNSAYSKFGLEVIADELKDKGPAGGIYTALKHSNTSLNFIVSCDMPFVNSDAVEYIIEHAHNSQIAVPVFQGNVEPLLGIYSKDCLTIWKEKLDEGVLKLQTIIAAFQPKKLDVTNNLHFSAQTFKNLNKLEDLIEE